VNPIICLFYLNRAEYQSRPKLTSADAVKDDDEDSDEEKENDAEHAAVDDFYDMDNYDDEVVETPGVNNDIGMMMNNVLREWEEAEEEELDSDEDQDEFTIQSDDNLILCGHVDGTVCMLEAYGKEGTI
jgi:hypothetical protein